MARFDNSSTAIPTDFKHMKVSVVFHKQFNVVSFELTETYWLSYTNKLYMIIIFSEFIDF